MKPTASPSRIWSDGETRKVASLLAIIRHSEELARGAAASDVLDLARTYQWARTDALETLRALLSDATLGVVPEPMEDELEETHPGVRKPAGAGKA